MKRFLLLLLVLVIPKTTYSQEVDIIGIGVKGQAKSNLLIPKIDDVEKVEVGAFYKTNSTATPDGDAAQFKNFNSGRSSDWNTDIIIKNSEWRKIGYFSETYNEVDKSGINLYVKPVESVHSFYSFIFYNDITSEFKSYVDLDHPSYYYRNGKDDPYVYNIPIEASDASRKIRIKIPVSELNKDDRVVALELKAGPVEFKTEVKTYKDGESFFLGEYVLKNVPGNVTNVSVTIYSPDNQYGDSFFISGIVVDVEKVGCTLTQGYWKTHSECKKNGNGPKRDATWDYIGEESIFFKSNQNYCEVFATQPSNQNGKYYILAHQYIATELNLYNNADPTDIAAVFKEATHFLEKYTPEDVRTNKDLQSEAVTLGGKLDEYNNGKTGPGHCGDDDDDDDDDENRIEHTFIKERIKKGKINIFPNPVTNNGQILFTTMNSGNTSVELYNLSGQKVSELYKGITKKGNKVSIPFSAVNLSKGLYIALIKNGNDVYRHKISVSN